MITSSVSYFTDVHGTVSDIRQLLPDADVGIYRHDSIPIIRITQGPGTAGERLTFLQPRYRLITHGGGTTLTVEPILSEAQEYKQLQSRIRRLELDLQAEREDVAEWRQRAVAAEARLQAVTMCRVWKDDLGRGRVFADDLRHAVDPEMYPEPTPVRLDSEDAADLALVQTRAATDNGNRTSLAAVLAIHELTGAELGVKG